MSMTDDKTVRSAEQAAVDQLVDAGLLDELMSRVDAGSLQLTGEGGFLPGLIKAVLERGMAAELTGHLGYEKGDPAGRGSPNSRNGTTPKTVSTRRSATSAWTRRGTGPGPSSRSWCRRAAGASGGSTR